MHFTREVELLQMLDEENEMSIKTLDMKPSRHPSCFLNIKAKGHLTEDNDTRHGNNDKKDGERERVEV